MTEDFKKASDIDEIVYDDDTKVSERMKLQYDEWKYRHDLFHRLQFRYTSIVAAIGVAPLFQAQAICEYGISTTYLGLIALGVGIMGIIHMLLEFSRVVELRIGIPSFTDLTRDQFISNFGIYYKVRKISFDFLMWGFMVLFVASVTASLIFFPNYSCPAKSNETLVPMQID